MPLAFAGFASHHRRVTGVLVKARPTLRSRRARPFRVVWESELIGKTGPTGSTTQTLGSLLALHLRTNIVTTHTARRYDLVVRNLAQFLSGPTGQPGDIDLEELSVDRLLDYRTWALTKMRAVSFNTERRHLGVLFNAAVRHGHMASNPLRSVPGAPVPRGAPKALTKSQVHAFIEWLQTAQTRDRKGRPVDVIAPQWFWAAVLRTLYLTGMRRRQLVGLRWSDVDFEGKTILLSSMSSKTRREWRVPLPDVLQADLMALRLRTLHCGLLGTAPLAGQQVFCLPLFSPRRGRFTQQAMSDDNLDSFFKRLNRLYPLDAPRVSAHRIRHSTATIMANNVANLKIVQEQLGHASITTTYGYVHPNLEEMRRATNALL